MRDILSTYSCCVLIVFYKLFHEEWNLEAIIIIIIIISIVVVVVVVVVLELKYQGIQFELTFSSIDDSIIQRIP